jgi:hypothetical protein
MNARTLALVAFALLMSAILWLAIWPAPGSRPSGMADTEEREEAPPVADPPEAEAEAEAAQGPLVRPPQTPGPEATALARKEGHAMGQSPHDSFELPAELQDAPEPEQRRYLARLLQHEEEMIQLARSQLTALESEHEPTDDTKRRIEVYRDNIAQAELHVQGLRDHLAGTAR